MEIKNEDCLNCENPEKCRNCGKLFDLSEDFKRHKNKTAEEVLKDECGISEMLCWECRDCK